MSQYGDSDLVNNPRYQGQAGGIDQRGPEGESRYGAMPTGTGTGNDPLAPIRNPAAYGFKKDEPEGFRYPGVDAQKQQQPNNLAGPNAQAGYGASQPGYGQQQNLGLGSNQSQAPLRDEFARQQPGYGQPGFGAPSQGQNTANLWPAPTPPPNARRSDLVGQDVGPNSGYNQSGVGTQGGYGQPREGIVNRAKDAVGAGPNSGYNQANQPGLGNQGYNQSNQPGLGNQGYNQSNQPGLGNQGYDQTNQPGLGNQGYGQTNQPGLGNQGYNQSNQPGLGNQGYGQTNQPGLGNQGYNHTNQPGVGNQGGYGQPREGIANRAKDAVGVGPNSGYGNTGVGPNSGASYGSNTQGYDPNVNHPSGERGFGGGVGPQGTNPGYDQNVGTGYGNNRTGTGAGIATGTGIAGAAELSNLTTGDLNLPVGQHVPESVLGERRTEPGYDLSKPGGRHHTTGTGLGHHGAGYNEGRGKGLEDPVGGYGTNTGIGGDNYDGTNTGTGVGTGVGNPRHHHGLGGNDNSGIGGDNYDGTNTGTGVGNPKHHHGLGGNKNPGIGGDNYDGTNTGTGVDNVGGTNPGDNYGGTNTGTTGALGDNYDGANTGTGLNDGANTSTAAPKKGLITKIKEKIHHTS